MRSIYLKITGIIFLCLITFNIYTKDNDLNTDNIDKILTFDEARKIRFKTPYIIDLKKGNKHLIFFGSRHSNDPNDPMFNLIEEKINDMKPDIALHEGSTPRVDVNSPADQIIINYSEVGFLIYMAKKNNVPYKTTMPPFKYSNDELLKVFDKDQVFLFYCCREIPGIQRQSQHKEVDFKSRMSGYIYALKKNGFPYPGGKFSYDNFLKVYKKEFNQELNWKSFNPEFVYPGFDYTILNKIEEMNSEIHNNYIVNLIIETLKKYDKVFVVMGSGHAIIQEPALRSIFK